MVNEDDDILVADEEQLVEALAFRFRDKRTKLQCLVDTMPHWAAKTRTECLSYLRTFESRNAVQARLDALKREVLEDAVLSLAEAQYKLTEWVTDVEDRMLYHGQSMRDEESGFYVRWVPQRDHEGNEIGRIRYYCCDDAQTLDELPDSVARYIIKAIWSEDEQCYILKLDSNVAMKDRLKAMELLMKFKGDYNERLEVQTGDEAEQASKAVSRDMSALEASSVYRDLVKGVKH